MIGLRGESLCLEYNMARDRVLKVNFTYGSGERSRFGESSIGMALGKTLGGEVGDRIGML